MSTNATRKQLCETEIGEMTSDLMTQVKHAQERLGLTDVEVAARTGLNRMTIQRAKKDGGDPQLSSFVAIASAVGLTTSLVDSDQLNDYPSEATQVHRSFAYNRLSRDPKWRDTKRETAFARAWEAVNEHATVGRSPVLGHLVPNHTQAQASAAATVIQWLGSDVGFEFMSQALEAAGYAVVESAKKR